MSFLDSKEKKVGFYSTIIFHLVVLIIFLLTAIHGIVSEETSFVLDFSKLTTSRSTHSLANMNKDRCVYVSHFNVSNGNAIYNCTVYTFNTNPSNTGFSNINIFN